MNEFLSLITCEYFLTNVLPYWFAFVAAVPISAHIAKKFF